MVVLISLLSPVAVASSCQPHTPPTALPTPLTHLLPHYRTPHHTHPPPTSYRTTYPTHPPQSCSGAAWAGLCDDTFSHCAPRPGALALPALDPFQTPASPYGHSHPFHPLGAPVGGGNHRLAVNGTGVFVLRVRGVVRDERGEEVAAPRLVGGASDAGVAAVPRAVGGASDAGLAVPQVVGDRPAGDGEVAPTAAVAEGRERVSGQAPSPTAAATATAAAAAVAGAAAEAAGGAGEGIAATAGTTSGTAAGDGPDDDGPPTVTLLGAMPDGRVPADALTLAWAPARLLLPHVSINAPR